MTDFLKSSVATKFSCRDKAWVGTVEASDDRASLVRDRAHNARDSAHSTSNGAHSCAHDMPAIVHCVVHYLGNCSWALFMGVLLKKKKKKNPKFQPLGIGVSQLGIRATVYELPRTQCW